MGYMSAMGTCFGCKRTISFNPHTVPSFKGSPICKTCIETVNAKRKATGLPLWPVAADAYEPVECG